MKNLKEWITNSKNGQRRRTLPTIVRDVREWWKELDFKKRIQLSENIPDQFRVYAKGNHPHSWKEV